MKCKTLLAAAITICATQFCRAEVKEETISADQIGKSANPSGKSSEYKLDVKDATLEQILEEFNKISGVKLQADGMPEQRTPALLFDVSIKSDSLDDALDDLAHQIHMGIANGGDSLRINPGYEEGFQGRNRRQYYNPGAKPDTAFVSGISINESLNDNAQRSKNMNITVTYTSGEKGMCGNPRIKVLEAVDEQGRDIAPTNEINTDNQRNRTQPHQQMAVGVNLIHLNPPSLKVARFKAEVKVLIPKTYKRYTITEIGDKKINCKVNGVNVQVGPVQKEGDQWIVKIRQPQNNSFRVVEDLQSMRVFAETGSAMYLQQNGWSGDGNFMEANPRLALFQENSYGQMNNNLPKPVSLVWDVVDEMETKTVIVEANDIVIP